MATILIIDEYPMSRDFLVTLLSYQKHRLLEASDGIQALEIIRKEPIDLIITDLLMPNMDGYELIQIIRADPKLAAIPVIFYTATYRAPEAQKLAAACSVGVVLAKPTEPQEILQEVEKFLNSYSIVVKKAKPWPGLREYFSLFLQKLKLANNFLRKLVSSNNNIIENGDKHDRFFLELKKLQDTNQKMSYLTELLFGTITERDPKKILKMFSRAAGEIMKAHITTIGIVQAKDNKIKEFYTSMIHKDNVCCDSFCMVDSAILEQIISKNRTMVLPNIKLLHNIKDELKEKQESYCFLGVPILASTQNFGVMCFVGKNNALQFSEEDKHFAITMAMALAITYENLQLYNRIQQHAVKLQLEATERKKVENDLRYSEQWLKLALEFGQMNAWNLNIQNNELLELGYFGSISKLKESSTLENFLNIVHPEDCQELRTAIAHSIDKKDYFTKEFRIVHNGLIQWVASRAQIYSDENGVAKRMIGVGSLITERKELEESLRKHQAELEFFSRVYSMAEMASALAHELNQPLAAINTYINGCILRLESKQYNPDEIIDVMKKTVKNINLSGEIVNRMKNYVRTEKINYELTEINSLIKEIISLFNFEIYNTKVEFNFEPSPNLPQVEINKIQIKQVLLNLLRNSIDAMKGIKIIKSKILIRTETIDSCKVAISISDSGPGILPDIRDSLFKPYFTTKPEGMGMGLAICRTIIEAHGGRIGTVSLPQGGACFQFELPFVRHEN
jgi:signal transduction histidine kinase/CheY-like chemotaxis protein